MSHRMVRMGWVVVLLAVAVSAVTASAPAQDAGALFKAKCSTCHAADGSGSTQMGKTLGAPDLRSEDIQKKTDAQLIDAVTHGVGTKMPAYKGKLTDAQIKDLVGYIRGLAKKT
ncbi:MAG: cytochrome c [Candidatus Acidiferrales bacterium]